MVGVRDWGGGLQAAELVFVVGEFVGWRGGQFLEGSQAEEELQDGDREGCKFTCSGGFVGEEVDLLLEFGGALGGLGGEVGDIGAASLAHAVACGGGWGRHGWAREEVWGGHVCVGGGRRGEEGYAILGVGEGSLLRTMRNALGVLFAVREETIKAWRFCHRLRLCGYDARRRSGSSIEIEFE